jgi:hypothetical protein
MLSAIIGMTVRNQLESLSAFNRNDCPLSSESAPHGSAWPSAFRREPMDAAANAVRSSLMRGKKLSLPSDLLDLRMHPRPRQGDASIFPQALFAVAPGRNRFRGIMRGSLLR